MRCNETRGARLTGPEPRGGKMEAGMIELVSAGALERRGILQKGTAYKMAAAGQIPSYTVGAKKRGVRFRVEEVLAALRRPATAEKTSNDR